MLRRALLNNSRKSRAPTPDAAVSTRFFDGTSIVTVSPPTSPSAVTDIATAGASSYEWTSLLGVHSPYARFLVAARSKVFDCIARHRVPCDPEDYFIASIIHSGEHWFVGTMTRWHRLALGAATWSRLGYDSARFKQQVIAPLTLVFDVRD
jgi:hypothetical protein